MKNNLDRQFRSSISYAALSASLAISLPTIAEKAQAQQQAIELGTITVDGPAASGSYNTLTASSPKQTAPLLDTPQTVTVIPQAIIREQGARNLTEVLRNTPGISFDAGENGFATSTNNFKIRGFDGSGNVYIDGARDSGSYSRDVFNVDRVEVFKGSSADNGRGGASGYVNMVTKVPTLQNFIIGEASHGFDGYDSKSRNRATVDINQVIAPNTAFRLNGLLESSGVAGRDVAENKPWGIAPSLAFGLGTDFRTILSYEHVTRRDVPDWGVPGATIRGLDTYDPRTAGASRDSFYGLRSDYDNVESDALLARFEYDVSKNVTVSNQTRWSRVDREARYTVPTGYTAPSTVPTQVQIYDRENTSISNLTNVLAKFDTGRFQHTVSAGIDITREESSANRYGTLNSNTNLFNPSPGRAVGAFPAATQRNDVTIDTIAAYAYDTIKLSEQWQVNGGLRVENYRVGFDNKTTAGASLPPLDGYSTSATTVSGKVGVVYKPVQNGSIYASFGVSHLPPGSYLSNPDISRTGDNAFPGFVAGADPTKFYNYEIGTKWDFFNNRLSTAVALFRTEKTNAPIIGRDPGDTADSLKGYGQQVVQGIELSVAGKLTDAWSVFGGLALIQSERTHSAYLDAVRRAGDGGAGDYGTATTTSGDELAFTPNVTGNLWTTYRFPIGLTLGGGVQYVGSSYLGRPDDANRIIPNGRFGKLPSYVLVHAMASYELTKNVDLRFNVDNVFDDTYAVSTNWGGARATLGPPRTFRVSTSVRF